MGMIERLRRSLGVSALATMLLMAGLAAAAAPAAANDEVTCTRVGNQLSWDEPANNAPIRIRGVIDDNTTKWVRNHVGNDEFYELTASDLAKIPSDRFLIRFVYLGERNDVECVPEPTNPGGNGFCQQDGTTLSWSQEEPLGNVFHIRKVNADFSTSWVHTQQAANPNTFETASAAESYVIRYRKTNLLGQTNVIDENCSEVTSPSDIECSVEFFGFLQESGYHIVLTGTTVGDSWTLLIDGVPSGEATEPTSEFIGDGDNLQEDVYFTIRPGVSPEVTVEVAQTNDLASPVFCGSVGEDPQIITQCSASRGDDPSTVELFVGNFTPAPFGVEVDGVELDQADIEPTFDDDIPFPVDPSGFVIPGLLTSSITITQPAGDVACTGDEVNFCTQFGTSLQWLEVADVWNDVYNVRQIRPDGSTKWISTTEADSALVSAGEQYLVRYRVEDAQGNQTVFDNVCASNN